MYLAVYLELLHTRHSWSVEDNWSWWRLVGGSIINSCWCLDGWWWVRARVVAGFVGRWFLGGKPDVRYRRLVRNVWVEHFVAAVAGEA